MSNPYGGGWKRSYPIDPPDGASGPLHFPSPSDSTRHPAAHAPPHPHATTYDNPMGSHAAPHHDPNPYHYHGANAHGYSYPHQPPATTSTQFPPPSHPTPPHQAYPPATSGVEYYPPTSGVYPPSSRVDSYPPSSRVDSYPPSSRVDSYPPSSTSFGSESAVVGGGGPLDGARNYLSEFERMNHSRPHHSFGGSDRFAASHASATGAVPPSTSSMMYHTGGVGAVGAPAAAPVGSTSYAGGGVGTPKRSAVPRPVEPLAPIPSAFSLDFLHQHNASSTPSSTLMRVAELAHAAESRMIDLANHAVSHMDSLQRASEQRHAVLSALHHMAEQLEAASERLARHIDESIACAAHKGASEAPSSFLASALEGWKTCVVRITSDVRSDACGTSAREIEREKLMQQYNTGALSLKNLVLAVEMITSLHQEMERVKEAEDAKNAREEAIRTQQMEERMRREVEERNRRKDEETEALRIAAEEEIRSLRAHHDATTSAASPPPAPTVAATATAPTATTTASHSLVESASDSGVVESNGEDEMEERKTMLDELQHRVADHITPTGASSSPSAGAHSHSDASAGAHSHSDASAGAHPHSDASAGAHQQRTHLIPPQRIVVPPHPPPSTHATGGAGGGGGAGGVKDGSGRHPPPSIAAPRSPLPSAGAGAGAGAGGVVSSTSTADIATPSTEEEAPSSSHATSSTPVNSEDKVRGGGGGGVVEEVDLFDSPTTHLSGWLHKQGQGLFWGSAFRKRWFQRQDSRLYYYGSDQRDKKTPEEPLGHLDLTISPFNVIPATNTKTKFGIDIETSTRVWHLQAEDDGSRIKWMSALKEWSLFFRQRKERRDAGKSWQPPEAILHHSTMSPSEKAVALKELLEFFDGVDSKLRKKAIGLEKLIGFQHMSGETEATQSAQEELDRIQERLISLEKQIGVAQKCLDGVSLNMEEETTPQSIEKDLKSIRDELAKEKATKAGLERLVGYYGDDPKAAALSQAQVDALNDKIVKLEKREEHLCSLLKEKTSSSPSSKAPNKSIAIHSTRGKRVGRGRGQSARRGVRGRRGRGGGGGGGGRRRARGGHRRSVSFPSMAFVDGEVSSNNSRFEGTNPSPSPRVEESASMRVGCLVQALYPFEAQGDREMDLQEGDEIRLTAILNADWLEGERESDGAIGCFPVTYVCVAPTTRIPAHKQAEEQHHSISDATQSSGKWKNTKKNKKNNARNDRKKTGGARRGHTRSISRGGMGCEVALPTADILKKLATSSTASSTASTGSSTSSMGSTGSMGKAHRATSKPLSQLSYEGSYEVINFDEDGTHGQHKDDGEGAVEAVHHAAALPAEPEEAPPPPPPITATATATADISDVVMAEALYTFESQGDNELALRVGEMVTLMDHNDGDEWWSGRRASDGMEGAFPANYVKILHGHRHHRHEHHHEEDVEVEEEGGGVGDGEGEQQQQQQHGMVDGPSSMEEEHTHPYGASEEHTHPYGASEDGTGAISHESHSITVIALYPFEAENERELSVVEGEELHVEMWKPEEEWQQVVSLSSGASGAVPTSYVKILEGH